MTVPAACEGTNKNKNKTEQDLHLSVCINEMKKDAILKKRVLRCVQNEYAKNTLFFT